MCGVGFIGWLIGLAYLFLVGMALTFLLARGVKKLMTDKPPPEEKSSDKLWTRPD